MFHIMVEEDRNKKFEMNRRNWRVLVAIEGLSDSIFPTLYQIICYNAVVVLTLLINFFINVL